MVYDFDYFISYFEAIPADKWMTNGYADGTGRHDACGFLGVVPFQYYGQVPAAKALNDLLRPAGFHILDVNDLNRHLGDHPKTRVLKALELAKAHSLRQL